MAQDADDEFYDRAQEHLRVASGQLSVVPRGRVSASMLYACARFNVWVSASHHASAQELRQAYGKTIEYFVAEYRKMLVQNLDDYVQNYEAYAAPSATESA